MTDASARKRLLLAFLIAPLAAPVAYIVGAIVVGLIVRGSWMSTRALLDLFIGVFTLGGPTAYVAAFVVGVPTYILLRRLGLVRRWTLWFAGAAIGAAGALALAPYLRTDLFSIRFPWWVAALLGVASAEVFWRVRGAPYADASR
jgi:hypothetical protein